MLTIKGENLVTWINSLLEKSQYSWHGEKPCLINTSSSKVPNMNKVHPFIPTYLNFQKDFNQVPYQKLRAFLRKVGRQSKRKGHMWRDKWLKNRNRVRIRINSLFLEQSEVTNEVWQRPVVRFGCLTHSCETRKGE